MESQVFEPLHPDSDSTAGGGDVSVTTVGSQQNGPSVTVTEAGGDPWTGGQQANDGQALTTDVSVEGAGLIDSWLADTSLTRDDVDVFLSAASIALIAVSIYYSAEGGR
jgi:hypothetical protein